jgi:Rrf2 family protein
MIRLPKKVLFAVEAVVDIAYYSGAAPVQSGEISERQGIPPRYLEQVLQNLVRAGLLTGQRGPRGGYRLARERRRITVGEIVRLVSAMDSTEATSEANGSAVGLKVVRPIWEELQQKIMGELDALTIEDLCQRARAAGIQSAALDRLDFSI